MDGIKVHKEIATRVQACVFMGICLFISLVKKSDLSNCILTN